MVGRCANDYNGVVSYRKQVRCLRDGCKFVYRYGMKRWFEGINKRENRGLPYASNIVRLSLVTDQMQRKRKSNNEQMCTNHTPRPFPQSIKL
jgi:hypothetical protein